MKATDFWCVARLKGEFIKWFLSLGVRVLEKKTTGLPSWLRVAEIATSDASVSTTRGEDSLNVTRTASSKSFLSASKLSWAGCGKGYAVFCERGLILYENREIHYE